MTMFLTVLTGSLASFELSRMRLSNGGLLLEAAGDGYCIRGQASGVGGVPTAMLLVPSVWC
jgi:hypothetical protein